MENPLSIFRYTVNGCLLPLKSLPSWTQLFTYWLLLHLIFIYWRSMAAVACLICTHILRAEKKTTNKCGAEVKQKLIKIDAQLWKKNKKTFINILQRSYQQRHDWPKDVQRGRNKRKVGLSSKPKMSSQTINGGKAGTLNFEDKSLIYRTKTSDEAESGVLSRQKLWAWSKLAHLII